MQYGNFTEDGREYIIKDPHTPRDWFNMYWNKTYLACAGQHLNGFSLYQNEDGVVTNLWGKQDMREAPRYLYVRDRDSGKVWSISELPTMQQPDKFECRQGLGYTILKTSFEGISVSFRIFVPVDHNGEVWTVTVKNKSKKKRHLSLFSASEVRLDGVNMTYGYLNSIDALAKPEKKMLFFRNRAYAVIHEKYRAFLYCDQPFKNWELSKNIFLGYGKNWCLPQTVAKGKTSGSTAGSENMVGVLQHKLNLKPSEEMVLNYVYGVVLDEAEADTRIAALKDMKKIETSFNVLQDHKKKLLGKTTVQTPDQHFNHLFNIWLKNQISLMADWTRFYFKGYRDTCEDAAGISIVNPELALKLLKKALANQRSDGFCPRAFRVPSMDVASANKHYADSPSWISHATDAILRETGDLSIFKEVVPYSDQGEATVWEHNQQALEFLWHDRGTHGLSLIRHGDWNDLIDKAGADGKGEGIWMSMALARVLKLNEKFAAWLGNKDIEKKCRTRFAELQKNILKHGFDKDYFMYALTDNGKKVGAAGAKQGAVFLNPQSWALLAGIISPEKYKDIMAQVEPILDTEVGPMHNWPPFTVYDHDIGQITCTPSGFCTNGNVYCHAATFKIAADYEAGRTEKAFATFKKILPAANKSEPYAQANGYVGPGALRVHKHTSDDPWRTGAVAWNFLNCWDRLLGFKRELRQVSFEPQLPTVWPAVSYTRDFRGTLFKVKIRRGKIKGVSVDGEKLHGTMLPIPEQGLEKKEVLVEVVL